MKYVHLHPQMLAVIVLTACRTPQRPSPSPPPSPSDSTVAIHPPSTTLPRQGTVYSAGKARYRLETESAIEAAVGGSLQHAWVKTTALLSTRISDTANTLWQTTTVDSFSVLENDHIPRDTMTAYATTYQTLLRPNGQIELVPNDDHQSCTNPIHPSILLWLESMPTLSHKELTTVWADTLQLNDCRAGVAIQINLYRTSEWLLSAKDSLRADLPEYPVIARKTEIEVTTAASNGGAFLVNGTGNRTDTIQLGRAAQVQSARGNSELALTVQVNQNRMTYRQRSQFHLRSVEP